METTQSFAGNRLMTMMRTLEQFPVPLHDSIDTGTLRSIADQAGAHDFEKFCEWIDRNR